MDHFRGLEPRPSQRKFLACRRRYFMFGGLVGPGKTWAFCQKAFHLSWTYPRNLGALGRWSETHLYDTLLESWKECFPLDEFGDIMRYDGGEREPRAIEIAARDPNNPKVLSWDYKSVIRLIPLSVTKRLPGWQLGFFGFEQAEQVPDANLWLDFERRLRRKNIPWNDQHGFGTCNYEENIDWINDLFVEKHIENRPLPPEDAEDYEMIEALPEETDANFGERYRKSQLAKLPPLKAKTLIQGIFVKNIGRVYKTFDESKHVREFEFADVARDRGGLCFVLGYDYGMSPDPTAIVFCGVDGQGRIWIKAEHVLTDTTVKDNDLNEKPGHESLVRGIAERIGFPLNGSSFPAGWDLFGKQSTGGTIADEWSDDFPWHPANCDVAAGIERVNSLLSTCPPRVDNPDELDLPMLIMDPSCDNLKFAMGRYKYADDGSGKPLKKQTPGVKDLCDAVRYAAMDAITPRKPQAEKSSILTADSYQKIVRAMKSGRRLGYWIPVVGGRDPALPEPKRIGPSYEHPL